MKSGFVAEVQGAGELKSLADLKNVTLKVACPAKDRLAELGVAIMVRNQSDVYGPGDCMGVLKPISKIGLEVIIDKRPNVRFCVGYGHQDSDGNATIELVNPRTGAGNTLVANWDVPVDLHERADRSKCGLPKWPRNRVYLVAIHKNGDFEFWNFGVFAQDYSTWVWAEYEQSGTWTRKGNGVTVTSDTTLPVLRRTMVEMAVLFVTGDLANTNRRFPVTGETRIAEAPAEMEPGTGVVQWFNPFMGTGYAYYKDEDGTVVSAKIHYSSIQFRQDYQLRRLEAGQRVKGVLEFGFHNNGPKKGSPRYELRNVRPI